MTDDLVPDFIDEAKVLIWAWAGDKPFGFIYYKNIELREEVFGIAICKYENENCFCRFCCDKNWETLQDGQYNSIEEAIENLPNQYRNVKAAWNTK